ncbi:MAG: YitT family protein [Erysipelotrichaceae bacterium]|nr:YitT family protein [Erysipelotrichaceae bacterium]
MNLQEFTKNKNFRNILTLCAVLCSSILQTYVIQAFIRPASMISSGFTGVALLVELLTEGTIESSFTLLALNIPVALLCAKSISPRFTIFSIINVISTSILLKYTSFPPFFDDIVLNVVFGGFLYGVSIVIALKGNASTGGTDFIALYFSNKFNKSLWQYVFIFNCMLIMIFGASKGWMYAGYSIVFQFISTKTISTFHTRYERLTLQITTEHPQEILDTYLKEYRHGISCMEGYGGFSKKPFTLMTTVVSSYEVKDIVRIIKEADPKVIINIFKTEDFVGGFKPKPID